MKEIEKSRTAKTMVTPLSHALRGSKSVVLALVIPGVVAAATVNYNYDALNRLSQVTYLDSTLVTYRYDPVGNWTTNSVTGMPDTDADGIPDWWMNQYFGHPTGQAADNSRASDDADGDGMTNLQEFLAGTSPIDPGSVLRINSAVPQGSDMVFTLATATNRQYALEWTTDLIGGIWTSLTNVISGDGTVQQVTHVDGAELPQRFYRIRLL
jgi:hypothetical protein